MTEYKMQYNSNRDFAFAAGNDKSASCAMSADSYIKPLTAIINLMAVVLLICVHCIIPSLEILISIILGVIILIVRGKTKPVSRT